MFSHYIKSPNGSNRQTSLITTAEQIDSEKLIPLKYLNGAS